MQIIQHPHPTLRHRSKPLKKVDAELRAMVAQMFELMYSAEGIGLAANQVDLPYRLFIINPTADPEQKDQERVFINPVLSKPTGSAESDEGCLSLPGVFAPVTRPERIHVSAFSLQGEEIDEDLSGLLSRVVQHETDHLDGVMFIDRLSPTNKSEVRESVAEFELDFQSRRNRGEIPDDEAILARLKELEEKRC